MASRGPDLSQYPTGFTVLRIFQAVLNIITIVVTSFTINARGHTGELLVDRNELCVTSGLEMDGLCSHVLQPSLQLLDRRDPRHHSHFILAHIICRPCGTNSGVMGPWHRLLRKQQVSRQPQERDEFLRIRLCDLRRPWWLGISFLMHLPYFPRHCQLSTTPI
ncbi:hypothetical protein H9Q73_007230 [Fusarium xylarioides]|nr:hypothetical protein H9Q73_007230 [Fusarium xylarioides]